MNDLNRTAKSIYSFIVGYKIANCGNSPHIRTIQDALNLSSTGVVDYNLKLLKAAGLIKKNDKKQITVSGMMMVATDEVTKRAEDWQNVQA